MGLEALTGDHSGCRYQRLRSECTDQEELKTVGRMKRRLRLRRRARGKAILFRMAPSAKRVRLMRLLFIAPIRRVMALYAEFLRRMMSADVEYPTIVFSSQWGLPVLSHPSSPVVDRNARLRAFYLERSLSAASSSC